MPERADARGNVKKLHGIELPAHVVTGSGAINEMPALVKKLGFQNVAIFTGPTVYSIVGRYVEEMLEDAHVDVSVFMVLDSSVQDVENSLQNLREAGADLAVAVGGGKVIDVTKYISYQLNRRFMSVPTTVSHDGIASPAVSLKNVENYPVSSFTRPPIAIIADVDVISSSPRRLLASGFGDIIGKFTSVRDAMLAQKIKGEYVGGYSLSLAYMSASMIARNSTLIAKGDREGVSILVEAAISCGVAMSIAGSSRPCSGSEHLFSHALDIVCPEKKSLHGEQVGVGTIMMAYLHGLNWRRIRRLLRRVGAPVTARELGVPPEAVVKALTLAHKVRDRYTILGETGVSEEAAWRLAEITGVID